MQHAVPNRTNLFLPVVVSVLDVLVVGLVVEGAKERVGLRFDCVKGIGRRASPDERVVVVFFERQ